MYKLDAMGKVCPVPVIETKKVLKSPEGKNGVMVLVDNKIATENLEKMAKGMNLSCKIEKKNEDAYEVFIGGEETEEKSLEKTEGCKIMTKAELGSTYVVGIGSDKMGEGAEELGQKLMGSFLYSLTEQDELPVAIVFFNGGVKLTVEGSSVLEDLKTLEEKGVEILSCGLCLNYYGLTEKLNVGSVTNMYRILELMRLHHTVRP